MTAGGEASGLDGCGAMMAVSAQGDQIVIDTSATGSYFGEGVLVGDFGGPRFLVSDYQRTFAYRGSAAADAFSTTLADGRAYLAVDLDQDGMDEVIGLMRPSPTEVAVTITAGPAPPSTWSNERSLTEAEARGVRTLDDAARVWVGEAGDGAGAQIDATQDLNADGYADLVLAAPWDDSAGENAGAIYLIPGPLR